tara:strand:- start:190 stop:858 length:669 start_codon:yes stop_codon:yes gene_type:complete
LTIGDAFKSKIILSLKLIILDFDGVVIDSNDSKQAIIIDYCLCKFRIYLPEKVNLYRLREFDRYEQCQIAKGSELTKTEKQEIDFQIEENYINLRIDPYLNTLCNLCHSKNIFLALVSSTPHKSLIKVVHRLSIDHYFDKIYGSFKSFDKAYFFKKLILDYNLVSKDVLSVGDHINDYFYSKECNIKFYAIKNSSFNSLNNNIYQFNNLYNCTKKIGLLKKK